MTTSSNEGLVDLSRRQCSAWKCKPDQLLLQNRVEPNISTVGLFNCTMQIVCVFTYGKCSIEHLLFRTRGLGQSLRSSRRAEILLLQLETESDTAKTGLVSKSAGTASLWRTLWRTQKHRSCFKLKKNERRLTCFKSSYLDYHELMMSSDSQYFFQQPFHRVLTARRPPSL